MKKRTFKTIILEDLHKRGRTDLARKIKSITYESFSMGNAVRVKALDMFKQERAELDSILDGYTYGRFDSMTDYSYAEYDNTKERQAKYVTLNFDFSEPIKKAASKMAKPNLSEWQYLCALESFDQLLADLDKVSA